MVDKLIQDDQLPEGVSAPEQTELVDQQSSREMVLQMSDETRERFEAFMASREARLHRPRATYNE